MSIQILPEDVKSRLRSGIAITNPRQCVEELVLNSLDANANCIAVRVNFKSFNIQVVDNGIGLSEDQLKLIGERYATNKCHSVRDLDKIRTYGFRGEALASILQMCGTLQVVTRTRENPKTYCKIYNLGRVVEIKEIAESRPSAGTTITVYNFLYNLPVRRKNVQVTLTLEDIRLRLQSIALIHPQVSFTLCDDVSGTTCLRIRRCNSVLANFSQIFGSSRAKNLKSVRAKSGLVTVEGYVSTAEGFHNKNLQFLYINKRLVLKTKLHETINSILVKHYSLQCADFTKKYYAVFVLNIGCPCNVYDIFFEPSKTYIEFEDWNLVTECVLNSICRVLSNDEDMNCERRAELDAPSGTKEENSDLVALGAQIATRDINTALISLPAKRNVIPSCDSTVTKRLRSQSPQPINQNEGFSSAPERKILKIPQEYVVTSYSDYVNGVKFAKNQLRSKSQAQSADGQPNTFYSPKRKLLKIPNEFITTSYSDFVNQIRKDESVSLQENILDEPSQEETNTWSVSPPSALLDSTTKCNTKGIDQRNLNSLHRFSYDKLTLATNSEKRNDSSEKKKKSKLIASVSRNEFSSSSTLITGFQAKCDKSTNGTFQNSTWTSKNSGYNKHSETHSIEICNQKNSEKNSCISLAHSAFQQILFENWKEKDLTEKLCTTSAVTEEINSPTGEEITYSACTDRARQDISSDFDCSRKYSFDNNENKSKFPGEILRLNDAVEERTDNLLNDEFQNSASNRLISNQIEKSSVCLLTPYKSLSQTDFGPITSKSITPNSNCDGDLVGVKETEKDHAQGESEAIDCAEKQLQQEEENIHNQAIFSHQIERIEKTGHVEEIICPQKEVENVDWMITEDSDLGKNIYIHKVTGNSFYDTPRQFGAEDDYQLPGFPMSFNLGSVAVPFTMRDRSIHPFTASAMIEKKEERKGTKESVNQVQNELFDGHRLTTSSLQPIQAYKPIQSYKFSRSMLQKAQVINQVDSKFIVCLLSDSQLIVLFDQHAVHERIRLEQLQKESEMNAESKSTVPHVLVIPPRKIVCELNQIRVVQAFLPVFARWGFELSVDQSDSKCILVHTMPVIFAGKEANIVFWDRSVVMTSLIENTIRDIISLLQTTGSANVTMPKSLLYVFNSFACRGAIKFGDELEMKECEYLIKTLGTCQLPFQCAHGRPSITTLADLKRVKCNKLMKTKPQLKKLRCFQQALTN